MLLSPTEPPGRANRKLRQYVAEIARLKDDGYTIEGIRKAFAEKGIAIGWSTVYREVARLEKPGAVQSPNTAQPPTPSMKKTDTKAATVDVDDFFKTHVSNPLLQRKKP